MPQPVNWNSYYSTGKGGAYVIQGNPALDQLKQQYAQQQQQRAQDEKDFTNELAKLNFNGARDADLNPLQRDYSGILNTFQQYRATKGPNERAQLGLALKQQQNQFMYRTQLSKEANTDFHSDAALAHNPNIELDPTYYSDMKRRAATSTFDPAYDTIKDNSPNWIVPKADMLGARKKILDASTTDLDQKIERRNINGIDTLVTSDGKKLDTAKLAHNVAAEMQGDRGFKNRVMRDYGSPENYIAQTIADTKDDYGYKDKVNAHEFPQRPTRFTAEQEWFLRKYGVPYNPNTGAAANNAPTYFQDLSERIRTEGKPQGQQGALAELNQNIGQNPEYLHGLAYDWSNPKAVKIIVPAKYKYDPKSVEDGVPNSGRVIVKPAYSTVLDSTNPDQWTAGFSRIYKDITGDASAVPTKAMTIYGKGHVPGGQSSLNPRQPKTTPDSFNAQWAKLPKGGTLVGPDGVTYTKK